MDIAEKRSIVRCYQERVPIPISPVKVAHALGLRVYRASDWKDHVSGMILKDKEDGGTSGFAIYVNGKHHINRRRFAIAHEIAHFVLHESQIGDGIADDVFYRSALSGGTEAQANQYATQILMPMERINEMLREGLDSIPALAKRFDVSNSTMSIRMGFPYEGHEESNHNAEETSSAMVG